MTARATIDGDEIVIRIRVPATPATAPSDRLIRLDRASCHAAGLELRGVRALVARGVLPRVRIGRAAYVRMSDLCALATTVAPKNNDVDAAFCAAVRERR